MRWDAAQMLFNAERRNLTNYQQGEALSISAEILTALSSVLEHYQSNVALTTLILTLPKAEFAELFKTIDPDGISVRQFMLKRHWNI